MLMYRGGLPVWEGIYLGMPRFIQLPNSAQYRQFGDWNRMYRQHELQRVEKALQERDCWTVSCREHISMTRSDKCPYQNPTGSDSQARDLAQQMQVTFNHQSLGQTQNSAELCYVPGWHRRPARRKPKVMWWKHEKELRGRMTSAHRQGSAAWQASLQELRSYWMQASWVSWEQRSSRWTMSATTDLFIDFITPSLQQSSIRLVTVTSQIMQTQL